jgi:hypothetical protein
VRPKVARALLGAPRKSYYLTYQLVGSRGWIGSGRTALRSGEPAAEIVSGKPVARGRGQTICRGLASFSEACHPPAAILFGVPKLVERASDELIGTGGRVKDGCGVLRSVKVVYDLFLREF